LETRSFLGKLVFAPFLLLIRPIFKLRYEKLSQDSRPKFQDLIPLADRSFRANEACNGCRICARVCPVGNIAMVDAKPVWQHHCETCFACYQWCPKTAIYGKIVEYEQPNHHPDVKVSDMVRRN
jgi:ferredoxin